MIFQPPHPVAQRIVTDHLTFNICVCVIIKHYIRRTSSHRCLCAYRALCQRCAYRALCQRCAYRALCQRCAQTEGGRSMPKHAAR